MKDEQEGIVQDVTQQKTNDNFMVPMISGITRNNPEIREYIDHVEKGMPLRTIAKRDGVHASTVLRRIRKIEARRDDPLMDDVLTRISKRPQKKPHQK